MRFNGSALLNPEDVDVEMEMIDNPSTMTWMLGVGALATVAAGVYWYMTSSTSEEVEDTSTTETTDPTTQQTSTDPATQPINTPTATGISGTATRSVDFTQQRLRFIPS